MKKLLALLLAAVMCLSLVSCGKETPNTNDNSGTQQGQQLGGESAENDITENTESPYVNHPLTPFLYGEWELEKKDRYDQDEEIPCSVLTINEDGTCNADGATGTWGFADGTKDDYLRVDVFMDGEHKLCVALYGTTNTIGVWSTEYNGPVDRDWINKSVQEDEEPQYETVKITLENWQEYFELKLVAFEQRNDFDELTYFFANTQLCLKEEWASIATDMEVAVEYACTNGYLCWFIYNEKTGEIAEGDVDERYGRTYEQDGTFTMNEYNIHNGYTVFGDTHSVTFEMEGDIAKIKGKMYPDVEIVRIQGTITIAE